MLQRDEHDRRVHQNAEYADHVERSGDGDQLGRAAGVPVRQVELQNGK